MGMPEAEEVVDTGDAIVIRDGGWNGGEVAVDGEAEGAADGGNTANDVGAIDGGSIPSMRCDVSGFGADFGVAASLIGGNGDCFVKEAEEAFDRDRLVVAA